MFCSVGHLKLKQTLTSYMFWDTTAMWDSAEKITFHSLLQTSSQKFLYYREMSGETKAFSLSYLQ